jgi:transcription initiation factor TFIID TATA-box-binding protein
MIKTSIVNVVATAALGQRIDLVELEKCPQIIHDPKIYRGRVAYFRSPSFAGEVTIFPSGKMISVGSNSETDAFRALDFAKEYLFEKGFIGSVNLVKSTKNIVVVIDLGHGVNLENLARHHKIMYEPEQFPGGILRMANNSSATALVHASGKAVVVGLKKFTEIDAVVQKLKDLVKTYT